MGKRNGTTCTFSRLKRIFLTMVVPRLRKLYRLILKIMQYSTFNWRIIVIKKYMAALAATALVAAPVVAAPAPASANLSVSKSVRTGAASGTKSELAGGGIIVAILAIVAIGAGIYIVADSDDDADSN
jgi:hypothetical protein